MVVRCLGDGVPIAPLPELNADRGVVGMVACTDTETSNTCHHLLSLWQHAGKTHSYAVHTAELYISRRPALLNHAHILNLENLEVDTSQTTERLSFETPVMGCAGGRVQGLRRGAGRTGLTKNAAAQMRVGSPMLRSHATAPAARPKPRTTWNTGCTRNVPARWRPAREVTYAAWCHRGAVSSAALHRVRHTHAKTPSATKRLSW